MAKPVNREAGVYVQGLAAMQRVLARGESELAPELKRRLREGGEMVRATARQNAPYRSNLPGKHLRDTMKVSVTRTSASVYSTSIYGGVQNFGGRVGHHGATLLRRASVSQYMTRAAQTNKERVAQHIEGVLDWLSDELEGR
jgi:hypothetical protein